MKEEQKEIDKEIWIEGTHSLRVGNEV